MNGRGLLSGVAGVAGGALAILPWLYFENPGLGSIALTCIGAVLAGISRADSLSDMLDRGNPGDDLLRDYWTKVKTFFSKSK